MKLVRNWQALGWMALALSLVSQPPLSAEPCSGFTWDVTQERALFGSTAQIVAAGKDADTAVAIELGRLYQLQLSPQSQVKFVAGPGKKMLSDGAFAGLAKLQVTSPGTYRVALDIPFWVDVVANGQLVPSKDFQGAPGCNAPHKIVAYDLPAAQPLVLQVSGATSATVHATVTLAPPPKP